jgi:leucyl-tRNA synthetase
VEIPAGSDQATHEAAARASVKIQAYLEAGTVRKVIVVPGRMVNFVVN